MSEDERKQKRAWPRPGIALTAFILLAILVSTILIYFRRGPELLYLLVPFILLATFRYRRWVYVIMLLWLAAMAACVGLVTSGDRLQLIEKILVVFVGSGAMAEITHSIWSGQDAAEKAMRESQRRLRATLEAVQSGILTIDIRSGKVLEANPAALELIGAVRDQVVGQPSARFFLPDKHADGNSDQVAVPDNENDAILVRADGVEEPILKTIAPATLGGRACQIVSFASLSRFRQAEKQLAESEKQLRQITDNMLDVIAHVDEQGVLKYASPSHQTVLGYPADSLLGSVFFDHVHPEDRERVRELISGVGCNGASGYVEYRFQHADSRYIWLESAGQAIVGDDGNSAGCVLASRDITDRKDAEFALRESEAKYRTLFNAITDPIIICEVDTGRILDCNQPAIDQYGYTREELTGLTFDRLSDDPSAITTQRRMTGEPVNIHVTRDGRRMEVDILSDELEFHGHKAAIHIVHDVTAQNWTKRVQAALYQIAQAAITADNLDELYRLVHAILSKLILTENYFIALYDAETNVVSFPYFIDQYDTPPAPRKPAHGLTEYVLSTGQPLLASPKVFTELIENGLVSSIGTPSLDWLGVPLIVGNRTIGVMVVQTYSEGVRFDQADLDILTFVSSQVAMAIERKRAEMALRQSETSLAEAQRLARLGNYQFSLDNNETQWSEETYRIFSRDPASKAPTISELLSLIHPDDRESIREVIQNAATEGRPFDVDFRIIDPGGMLKYIYSVGQPVFGAEGKVVRFFGTLMDITERKLVEEELRQAHTRLERHSRQLAHILDTSYSLRINLGLDTLLDEIVQSTSTSLGFGAIILNLLDEETGLMRVRTTYGLDEDGRHLLEGAAYSSDDMHVLFQERFRVGDCYFIPEGEVDWDHEMSGPTYARAQPAGEENDLDETMWHSDDMLVVPILLHQGQVAGFISVDKPNDGRRPDREKLQALAIFTNQAAAAIENARLYERAQAELAERKRAEERLWVLSTHDTLTGLYNRAYFEAEMVHLKPDSQSPVSVVMADVDNLKATNDRLGHAAGDDLLRRAARVLKSAFRVEDIIARIGGDEFAVLLPGADDAAADEGMQRVVSGLAAHNARYPGIPLHLSVGTATADQRTSLEEALKLADERMYHSKHNHRKEKPAS